MKMAEKFAEAERVLWEALNKAKASGDDAVTVPVDAVKVAAANLRVARTFWA